jgi:coproporphyrinogen III oxidase
MLTIEQKSQLSQWFTSLQTQILSALEEIEKENGTPVFAFKKSWLRGQDADEGGGTMGIIKGCVFEKGGANVSTVYGQFSEAFRKEIPGAVDNPNFWASGLSLVIHPKNPYVPIVHMNTRCIETSNFWFGGGADLTPTFPFEEDTQYFHECLKEACDQSDDTYYERYKKWCDEYFYLPHRKEPRGVGGIFYDNLNSGDFEKDFAFTKAVGMAFLKAYPTIVRRRFHTPYGEEEIQKQLIKRARYVEFNLVYDRGTRFGFMTGANPEALLMSLPPLASWAA